MSKEAKVPGEKTVNKDGTVHYEKVTVDNFIDGLIAEIPTAVIEDAASEALDDSASSKIH